MITLIGDMVIKCSLLCVCTTLLWENTIESTKGIGLFDMLNIFVNKLEIKETKIINQKIIL